MKQRLIGAWVVAAALIAAAPGAFAFQFVNPDSNSGGTTNFTDPDQQTQKLTNRFGSGNGSTGTLKFGNSTLQFGMSGRGSDNYGPSPAIQEKFVQSPASHTVPSQGW